MNGFRVLVDLREGEAVVEGGSRIRKPHPSGLILAADARLDNRKELLDALAADLPGTPEDADLILAAYLKWGESCPECLLGDFAFAVWDPRNRRLFAARDHLGVRSLYWTRQGSRVGVASAVYPLLEDPATPRRVDLVAVGDYLAGLTSEPDRTFFQDVYRLPSGHHLTATAKGCTACRYWNVTNLQPAEMSEKDAVSRFLELLRQAVRDRTKTSSGPVGIAMSGGLDSTSVAAIAQEPGGQSAGHPLKAYSFVFDQLKNCDERPYIKDVSEALGIETSYIPAESFWFLGNDEAYAPPLETPMMSWESPFLQLFQSLRDRGGKVLLTGHGADDLLTGSHLVYADRLRRGDLRVIKEVWKYSRSRQYGWRPFYRQLIEPLLSVETATALHSRFSRRAALPVTTWITPDFARRTGLPERLAQAERFGKRTASGEMHRRLIASPSYQRAVEWYDRNAGPFGIEVRHPFLDRRLFEHVLTLPPCHLFRLGERKPLLRRALAGILPDSVRLRHDKVSLGGLVDFSLKKEVDRVRGLLAAPLVAELGIVDGGAVRQAFELYAGGERSAALRSLWYVVTVELWLRRHFHTFDSAPFETLRSAPEAA
jgi:asparagine synthase (glutamine-hydrolysing)